MMDIQISLAAFFYPPTLLYIYEEGNFCDEWGTDKYYKETYSHDFSLLTQSMQNQKIFFPSSKSYTQAVGFKWMDLEYLCSFLDL